MELDLNYMIQTLVLTMNGIPVTMGITLTSLILSTPIAFFIAISKIYRLNGFHQVLAVYTSFVRGTPIVLQILLIYSLLPSLLNSIVVKLDLGIDVFAVNPILYAIIVFTINCSAGLSEVFRSALLTVNRGQLEAAFAVGLSPVQAYRRIILPQAMVVALPNICNLTINLIKGTSLAFLMTVKDVTAIAKIEASFGYNYIESYIDIFIVYLIICSITQLIFSIIEKRMGSYQSLVLAR